MVNMKKGIMEGQDIMGIARDFSTVPASLLGGMFMGEIGAGLMLLVAPYLADSEIGGRMGQYTALLVLFDLLFARFGKEAI